MKRITSLVLIAVLMIGIVALSAQPVSAASAMKTSDDLVKVLKLEEGFIRYPTWDYGQYSVGYGTRCPDDMLEYYKENGITESEAELLLRNYLTNAERMVNTKLIDKNGLTLTQGQFDAIVSFSYNMGSAWMSNPSQNIYQQIVNGATGNDLIDAFVRWCNAGGQVQHYLIRRRLSEANMYLNGVYSRTAPANFAYVTYDGNGGTISQKIQGYDANLTAVPHATATYNNYTFAGWYTDQVGGIKVETLTEEHNGHMLFAHWKELEPLEPEESKDPVTVTVTTNGVNLRKGPGTNYAIVGIADTGEKFVILQVRTSGGYTWGQYDGGWICLDYTDYETVISKPEQEPTQPETTKPTEPPTEPATSTPTTEAPTTAKPTEPPTTAKPTEPPTTAAPTEPPTTAKPTEPAKVTGTVNANPYLCVRQGPGTGYSTVDTLQTGEKVTITEQRTVGSMIWGKISSGWISMSYVTLDQASQPETESGGSTQSGKTGTVTCAVLNVRKGAGVNYGIAGYYYKGNTVTITEQKTVGATTWGKTAKGWVSMDYVTLKDQQSGGTTTPAPEQGSTVTGTSGTVVSNDVLRIRGGAGTSYAIVGFLNPGAKVTVTEQKTVGATTWGKVSKGWVSMDYIKLDSNTSDTTEPPADSQPAAVSKTVTVSCLCVRSGAGTSNTIVGYLYKGSKVSITETKTVGSSQWGKTAQGWICLDYTK